MRKHQVALWSGIVSFFGTLLAIGIFDTLTPQNWFDYLQAFIVAFITAGSMYSKARFDEVKREERYGQETS